MKVYDETGDTAASRTDTRLKYQPIRWDMRLLPNINDEEYSVIVRYYSVDMKVGAKFKELGATRIEEMVFSFSKAELASLVPEYIDGNQFAMVNLLALRAKERDVLRNKIDASLRNESIYFGTGSKRYDQAMQRFGSNVYTKAVRRVALLDTFINITKKSRCWEPEKMFT